MNGLLLQFDGGAPSTGGDGGFGAVLCWPDGEVMEQLYGYLGSNVNHHICEYCGLIYGVRLAREHAPATLRIIGDSMMVVKQVTGDYRVRGDHLAVLHAAAAAELAALPGTWTIEHTKRTGNKAADKLATRARTEKTPTFAVPGGVHV